MGQKKPTMSVKFMRYIKAVFKILERRGIFGTYERGEVTRRFYENAIRKALGLDTMKAVQIENKMVCGLATKAAFLQRKTASLS